MRFKRKRRFSARRGRKRTFSKRRGSAGRRGPMRIGFRM